MIPRLVAIDPAGSGKESVAGVAWYFGSGLVAAATVDKHEGLNRLQFHPYGWPGGRAPVVWFATDWLVWRAIVRGWPAQDGWPDVATPGGLCLECGYQPRLEVVNVKIGRRQEQVPVVRGCLGDYTRGPRWPTAVLLEQGHGAQARSVDMLAWSRGYISALAQEAGVGTVAEINNATWRGHVGRHFGLTFPRDSKAAKALALELAGRQMGVTLPKKLDDLADAVLLGLAGCKLGLGR